MRLLRTLQIALLTLTLSGTSIALQSDVESLFDGKTLNGWEVRSGEEDWWRVEDGKIVGGSLHEQVPHNTFLSSTRSFQNFELEFEIRIKGAGGFVNSGFQIRSIRVEGNHEMSGYQIDAGDGWWGKMYDESRRNKVIAEPMDQAALDAAVRGTDWNRYKIRATGRRIQTWINGVAALDFTESDFQMPMDGHFGLQVHGGGKALVELKNIEVNVLPPTAGAMTWRRWQKTQSVQDQGKSPIRSAADELAGFDVLEGFEVELVASDPMMQKVVDINFDDSGRMWAITAVEYPIDGNESKDVINLYRQGGRDQVLVFDDVWKPGPHKPRVFADGLFIPMAILPEQNGALVGMGPDILRFTDDDGDGKADRREVVLSGFGIQDSHLLPHRFKRMPGGWIYLAQGAFNSSNVKTKNGDVVAFNKCKIGRFQADGSKFEIVGIGLNNIWGFVIDRLGDKWVQEANDLGFPMTPFEHGMSYPGIGSEKFHSHSPWRPALAEFRMGGTGLSGLAQSGDRNGFPAPWDQTFFLANPIISSLQSVQVIRRSDQPQNVELRRVADLLVSEDKNFRPVAIHFGPDGCLYVVDWYNPIISHNEVPRNHPSRDKTSSRIWRIRHQSQAKQAPVDVARASSADLVDLLGHANTGTARAAWHQISARQATQLVPKLLELVENAQAATDHRLLALWSLHDLKSMPLQTLRKCIAAPEYSLRRAAIDLAGEQITDPTALVELLANTASDPDPRVRLVAIQTLGKSRGFDSTLARLLLSFLRPENLAIYQAKPSAAAASALQKADENLEYSSIRAILEQHPAAVITWLDEQSANYNSNPSPADAALQRYALLCAADASAAAKLAQTLNQQELQPNPDELIYLARYANRKEIQAVFDQWLKQPKYQVQLLQTLLDQRKLWNNSTLKSSIAVCVRHLAQTQPSAPNLNLLLRAARELRLNELEGDVIQYLNQGIATPLACLQALMEMGCDDVELYFRLANSSLPGEELRLKAVDALAAVPGDRTFELLLELWPTLWPKTQAAAMRSMLGQPQHARNLLSALLDDRISTKLLDEGMVNQMRLHAADQPAWKELERQLLAQKMPGIKLLGGGQDFLKTNITQRGPFTLEAWIWLEPGISNADGLLAGPNWDFNFSGGLPRLWLGPRGDVLISKRPLSEQTWTHLALSYDGNNRLSLYRNGELEQSISATLLQASAGLEIGKTTPGGGTAASLTEVRYWTTERSADQIAGYYQLRLNRETKNTDLQWLLPQDEVGLSGNALIRPMLQQPPLKSQAEAKAEMERIAHFRDLARADGNLDRGKNMFLASCFACHQVEGMGGNIGPSLDGVGAKTDDGLLRSILTPNAGVESGYRVLSVQTADGELLQGFLAAEDALSITLRRAGRVDLKLSRNSIKSLRFEERSLMPEGLLDAMQPQQVSDLFTYLRSLH
ncbi:MAG: DUF1080 domain-containing protein [Planctomycetes bacterium]|nr:DUF1080 domain-containing protein [Planctomycetota bacterium]